ncbi:Gustatory receptor 24a, partial [Halyomorpha halys]
MPNMADRPHHTLEEMLQNMFRVSSFCGVFPFVLKGNNLFISYKFLIYSIVYLILVSFTITYYFLVDLKNLPLFYKPFMFNSIIPYFLPQVICIISVFWQWINLKKFNKIFRRLMIVEDVTHYSPLSYRKQLFCFISCDLLLFIFDCTTSTYPSSLIIPVYLSMTSALLIMIQFISILDTINSYYSHLQDTLSTSTAMEWTQYHEILGSCCEIVNKCYSPQLFVFTILTFMHVTDTIYDFITYTGYFPPFYLTISIIWIFLISFSMWIFTHYCQETVQKTKEFNHLLYQLMINDKSSELMRNEKLLLHLSMKREVVMTACGLFNLDFGLLHSMVAAASTYLVMLIQVGQQ